MTRPKSNPWASFANRDDRALLREFSAADWASHRVLDRIPGTVFAALRALHFSRSNRWGLAVSMEKLKPLAIEFLDWMKKSGEWDRSEIVWSKKGKGPWSMPFLIFRSYYRFRRTKFPQGIKGEVSYSGQRSMLDMDTPLEKALAGPVLEAFSFVTFSLPDHLQLGYQLHLEGLLPEEISRVLGVDKARVEEIIDHAKIHLSAGYTKLRESA